jgi:hypothetical protein
MSMNFHKKISTLIPNADHYVSLFLPALSSTFNLLPERFPSYGAAKVITFSILPKYFLKYLKFISSLILGTFHLTSVIPKLPLPIITQIFL